MLLSQILPRAVAEHAGNPAVVCGGQRLSYAELGEQVARVAAGLRGLGVEPGDRIAILHCNCHHMLEAYFAAVHAQAVLVPLNYRLTAVDLAFILDDTGSRVLIVDEPRRELAAAAAAAAQIRCAVVASADLATSSSVLEETAAAPSDPANIYYTSGTTGHQKGVVLTNRNIASHAASTIRELALDEGDSWAHIAPMFHLADAWATWAITMVGGCHVMAGAFDAGAVLGLMADERISVTNLIPTMLNDLVHHPDAENRVFPDLRLIMSGGAPISPHLVRRIVEIFGCEYVQTYGLTETSPYLTFSILDEHLRTLPEEEQMRYRSMTGRAADGVKLRVVDEAGADVTADGRAVGEIIARGDRITPGYWRLPEATAEAFVNGWFHTGDLATINAEGFLNIVDRKKDVIITGGELVYSTEVEHALHGHPAVRETAVVGLPDDRFGEAVHAVIVLATPGAATAGDLIAHCRERLAHFKCPRSVRFIDALPRTGSGKISKKDLR